MVEKGLELFRDYFFWIDFMIAGAAPLATYALYRLGKIDKYIWVLFWVGFCIGLTWEVPMQLVNNFFPENAVHVEMRGLPVHFSAIILAHSLWDGGLFILGVLAAWLFSGSPLFARFNWKELIALIVWGQASELWVELTATFGEAWAYIPRWYNPELFKFNGHPITLMPQLIWLAAPIVFYFIALWLRGYFPAASADSGKDVDKVPEG